MVKSVLCIKLNILLTDCESPRGDHEHPVPDEPLIELAAFSIYERLLVVPGQEDAHGGGEHPGADHECTMELKSLTLSFWVGPFSRDRMQVIYAWVRFQLSRLLAA